MSIKTSIFGMLWRRPSLRIRSRCCLVDWKPLLLTTAKILASVNGSLYRSPVPFLGTRAWWARLRRYDRSPWFFSNLFFFFWVRSSWTKQPPMLTLKATGKSSARFILILRNPRCLPSPTGERSVLTDFEIPNQIGILTETCHNFLFFQAQYCHWWLRPHHGARCWRDRRVW